MSPTRARRRLLLAGARVAAGAVVLAGVPGMLSAVAGAPAAHTTRGRIVALAFERASRSLIKANPDALYRSADEGRHWTPFTPAATSAARHITSMALSAGAVSSLYVAVSGIGILRGDDGGRRWSPGNDGLPGTDVAALATHADRSETVYAYFVGRGIFRSEDGGRRWRLMDAGPRSGITRFVHSNMPGSMQSGWLFAAAPQGVQRSMDCFCGWRDAGELRHAVRAVAYNPQRPSEIYAATDGGLFFSADGGEQWSPSAAPAATIEALLVTPGGAFYAADADGGVFRRTSAATPWERIDA